jgi:branched-chain amino acid transport system substrate-binding protein
VFAVLTLGCRAALVLVPALAIAACTSPSTPRVQLPSSVEIGLLTPKSGANAPTGVEAIHGAELAIDIVNNAYPDLSIPLGPSTGLGNGVKLTLAVGDTEGAPERVEEQASKLVKNGAIGLVLADGMAVARSAGREVDLLNVAMVDATSTADLFGDLNRTGHFRIQPSDRSAVKTVLSLLFREQATGRAVDKIAVIAPFASVMFNEEIDTIKKAIGDLGQADGFTTALNLSFGSSATDLTTAVVDGKANVAITIVTNSSEAAAAVELATRLKGIVPVIALGPGVASVDIAKASQSDLLRASGWSAEYSRRNPVALQVAQLYEQRYSAKLTEVAASSFTATLALALAIDNAKGLTVGDIRASVQQLSLSATQTIMPWDGIRFDSNGNNQLAASVIEQRSANGFQVIHPVELAAATLAWP